MDILAEPKKNWSKTSRILIFTLFEDFCYLLCNSDRTINFVTVSHVGLQENVS